MKFAATRTKPKSEPSINRPKPIDLDQVPEVEKLMEVLGKGNFLRDQVESRLGRNNIWVGPTNTGESVFVKRLLGDRPDVAKRVRRSLDMQRVLADHPEGADAAPASSGTTSTTAFWSSRTWRRHNLPVTSWSRTGSTRNWPCAAGGSWANCTRQNRPPSWTRADPCFLRRNFWWASPSPCSTGWVTPNWRPGVCSNKTPNSTRVCFGCWRRRTWHRRHPPTATCGSTSSSWWENDSSSQTGRSSVSPTRPVMSGD